MNSPPFIRTPPAQRWHNFRIRSLPVVGFIILVGSVVLLWRKYVAPPNTTLPGISAVSPVPRTTNEWTTENFNHLHAGKGIPAHTSALHHVVRAKTGAR